jgi:hypothetical protein
MSVTITEKTARRIASEWHGGQTSLLYAFASSGAIVSGIRSEIAQCLAWCKDHNALTYELELLRAYVNVNSPKGEKCCPPIIVA